MKTSINLAHVTFTYENCVEPLFETISFQSERSWTSIVGANGSGKSKFITYFINQANLKKDKVLYIPQEIPIIQSKRIIERIQGYSGEKKGEMMTIVNRLGSDPGHVLETTIPSPGEVRKLMLAEGIMFNPGIIIMDEPTNHMDLPSIECVEQALSESPSAQVLVSHDQRFLRNTVSQFWSFSPMEENEYVIDDTYDRDNLFTYS